MKTITIKARKRDTIGKKNAKNLRRNGEIPCVLYGGKEVMHFSAPSKDFKNLIYSPDFYKVVLDIDGSNHEAIVKDKQFHPVKDTVDHIDFLELKSGESFTTEIPIKLEGTAPGVREGGKMKLRVRRLAVKLTPDALVENIVVDVSELELGKSVRVSDVSVNGVEILNSPGIPIASCEIPRALRGGTDEEEAADAEGAEAPAEGEAAAPAAE